MVLFWTHLKAGYKSGTSRPRQRPLGCTRSAAKARGLQPESTGSMSPDATERT
jgi:hypothetical protein